MQEWMTVGELARHMGVTVRTLQYYDREGLLRPSARSEGGRRLYTAKDVVRLHQILSFKYLGFSLGEIKDRLLHLDAPEEVARMLERQGQAIQEQIDALQSAARAVEGLREEVLRLRQVDFGKYAEIIELLRKGDQRYWVWKCLDAALAQHVRQRFGGQERGERVFQVYQRVVEEAVRLHGQGVPPDSEQGLEMAGRWWDMVMEFTGGDMRLLPSLVAFNEDKSGWPQEMARRQQAVDDYISQALEHYLAQKGITAPWMEGEHV